MTRAWYVRAASLQNLTVILLENVTLIKQRDNSNAIDFRLVLTELNWVNKYDTIIVESIYVEEWDGIYAHHSKTLWSTKMVN